MRSPVDGALHRSSFSVAANYHTTQGDGSVQVASALGIGGRRYALVVSSVGTYMQDTVGDGTKDLAGEEWWRWRRRCANAFLMVMMMIVLHGGIPPLPQ